MDKSSFTIGEVVSSCVFQLKNYTQKTDFDLNEFILFLKFALIQFDNLFFALGDSHLYQKTCSIQASPVDFSGIAKFELPNEVMSKLRHPVSITNVSYGNIPFRESIFVKNMKLSTEHKFTCAGYIEENKLMVYIGELGLTEISFTYISNPNFDLSNFEASIDIQDKFIPCLMYFVMVRYLITNNFKVSQEFEALYNKEFQLLTGGKNA